MSENWVKVEISRKQVITDNPVFIEKTNKEYARVIAPGGGSFLYPLDSLMVNEKAPEKVYFVRPEGTEIQVSYGERKENVPDSAPNKDMYENVTRTFLIEDLKAAYEEERRNYAAEMNPYVNMTVPTSWGQNRHSDDKGDFVSISVPVDKVYYSFLVKAEYFKPSKYNEGMSYFGFPKKKKETDEVFTVTLKHSEKLEDGTYAETAELVVTPQELKGYVDAAVNTSRFKEKLVSVDISNKLVKPFTSNEGKYFCDVSVPLFNEETKKERFYRIVVPAERITDIESNKVRLSLFKKNQEDKDFTFNAVYQDKNEEGQYVDVDNINLTSEQVVDAFKASKTRYLQENISNDHSLADILKGNQQDIVQENNMVQEQNQNRLHHGR